MNPSDPLIGSVDNIDGSDKTFTERITCLYAAPPSSLTTSTAVPFAYLILAVLQDDVSVFGTNPEIQFHSPIVKSEIESHTIFSGTATAYRRAQAGENDK